MSTQSSSFPPIPFSISHPQQNFRVLELPPDLLELISSDSKPATLQLKSTVPILPKANGARTSNGPGTGADKVAEGFLHVCSDDKIWAVRQVSTSNSVYITAPRDLQHASSGANGGEGAQPPDTVDLGVDMEMDMKFGTTNCAGVTTSLAAISQVSSVLELVSSKITQSDVDNLILERVPVCEYNAPEDTPYLTMSGVVKPAPTTTLQDLFTSIAGPNNLIRSTIRTQLVFTLPHQSETTSPKTVPRYCYIPSAGLILQAWKILMQICNLRSLDLCDEHNFRSLVEDVRAIGNEDDVGEGDVYAAVFQAILRNPILWRDTDENYKSWGEFDMETGVETEQQNITGVLDPVQTALFFGRVLVRSAGKEGIERNLLEKDWAALFPDSWDRFCNPKDLLVKGDGCDLLEGEQFGKDMLRWVGHGEMGDKSSGNEPSGLSKAPATTAQTGKGKRDWHKTLRR